MFPLSIRPFAHRCCQHSRPLTIATNYPHFFFFVPAADEIPTERRLSCVCLREKGAVQQRKRDSMCLSGVGVCLFGL